MNAVTPQIYVGTSISPGLAEGPLHVGDPLGGYFDGWFANDLGPHDSDEEISRLDRATLSISEELLALAEKVEREIDAKLAQVFSVHHILLEDASLKAELRREITENLVSAGSAVKTVFLRWENRFLLMESQIARDKGDDMRDLSRRLRGALAGISAHPLEDIPEGCVLVAMRLLPSDTMILRSRSTVAVLLEHGSHGSHAALFAREMGLPCISGLAGLVALAPIGALALVDAEHGKVTVHPARNQVRAFHAAVRRKKAASRMALEHAKGPALTRDRVRIAVMANVGNADDTRMAMESGAEGVGLYRVEQAYIGRTQPPDPQELFEEMEQTLDPARGMPVCVRLLDIGADKPLPFLGFLAESNPSLGRRGIRLLLEYPELLDSQLRTILKLAEHFDLSVLVPMVCVAADMLAVRERLRAIATRQRISKLPPLGAMLETPAAVLDVRKIARHSDFVSFGTNDLTQYAFAADRENAAVERYFDDASDVIFRLLEIGCEEAGDLAVSLCGELAGRPDQVSRILQCGIRTLSVAPPLVPAIKEAIRGCTLGHQP
ncbi:phosphoenolpyruvate-protein phosphotransferase [Haloferula luteola]|uniref:Phosphoenolpyruvate-protein phosphotransferase n=1 Tax=Haloferula luteola TaxID=595692 RepID=A0A840UVG5_9BACT|nr:putative PEP-binding protein [Haloferula luteola]MBB5350187.1 phosphoenolpyruvate-protein phosphotransferase [Haloferula luteola]